LNFYKGKRVFCIRKGVALERRVAHDLDAHN